MLDFTANEIERFGRLFGRGLSFLSLVWADAAIFQIQEVRERCGAQAVFRRSYQVLY